MSETITLNFINQSEDNDSADVMICQHNAAAGLRCNPVAWRVLRGVTPAAAQSFEVPRSFEVSVGEVAGAQSDPRPVVPGYAYGVVKNGAGLVMQEGDGDVENRENVSIPNLLDETLIDAHAYKDGRLIAVRTNVDPGAAAAFRFVEHVYVGLAGRVQEGEVISDAVASRITTRINLFGITSADIVMTSGEQGRRFPIFRLENIKC